MSISSTEESEERPLKRIKLDAGITLPRREEITTISATEFEDCVREVTAVSSLSHSQMKYVNTCRRLIRNRDHARDSRQRKKAYTEYLESRIDTLEMELYTLHNTCRVITEQNNELKKQKPIEEPYTSKLTIENEIEWF